MVNFRIAIIEKINYKTIFWFIGLMAIASILPQFIHNQFITGPIINATLFLAAFYLETGAAVLVGIVPSVAALSSGLLPALLAPMVPFIMIANAILILTFNKLKSIHFGSGAIAASMVKYLFLYLSANLIINTLMPHNLAVKAAAIMMSWPQLVTSLAGAVIAFGIIKFVSIYHGKKEYE